MPSFSNAFNDAFGGEATNGPPPCAAQAKVNSLATATARSVAEQQQCDKTYTHAWKSFTSFVDSKRSTYELPPGDIYLTRINVDLFFLEVVANKTCSPSSCCRFVSGLQWFSTHKEHVEALGAEPFNVVSTVVTSALQDQKRKYQSLHGKREQKNLSIHPTDDISPLPDPYVHLKTNVVTPEHTEMAMKWAVKNLPDWGSPSICWTWGISSFIRNSSI